MPPRAKVTKKKSAETGKRYPLNMRTTFEMRQALEGAAKASGRSLAQEAEFRIDKTIHSQSLLSEALELAYGRELAGLLLTIGEAMKDTGGPAGFMSTLRAEGVQNWWDDPYAYAQVTDAALTILAAFRPEGISKSPSTLSGKIGSLDLATVAENFGRGIAAHIVREIASTDPITSAARAPRLRRSLGALAQRARD